MLLRVNDPRIKRERGAGRRENIASRDWMPAEIRRPLRAKVKKRLSFSRKKSARAWEGTRLGLVGRALGDARASLPVWQSFAFSIRRPSSPSF